MARLPWQQETNVRVYDGALAPELCRALVSAFCETPGHKPLPGPNGQPVAETLFLDNELTCITDERMRERWTVLTTELCLRAAVLLQRFMTDFVYLEDKTVLSEGYQFVRFPQGHGYSPLHRDVGPNRPTLVFSLIYFLNDVDAGGDVEFPYQKLRVPAKAGRLIIAPPFWTHIRRSLPPQGGDQFMLENCFLFDPDEAEPARVPAPRVP